ncbi:MAG: SagB/ThcOx family dehydrogenase [bacterium]
MRKELLIIILLLGLLIVSITMKTFAAYTNWPIYSISMGETFWPGVSNYTAIFGYTNPFLFSTSLAGESPWREMNLLPPPPLTFQENESPTVIKLTDPYYDSNTSIERALLERRSVRDYKNEALSIEELSQLLWAAQGITAQPFYKTAPSAGGLYPLDLYIVAGNVKGLSTGIYKYIPEGHELIALIRTDKREDLYNASLYQSSIAHAPLIIAIGATPSRTTQKYGERGNRYIHIEVGTVVQNIYLQAVSLNLGTVVIGAFHDEEVKKVLTMENDQEPLVLMPIGKK